MNILMIGNSYTYYNDMPRILQTLCDQNQKHVHVYSVTKGGRTLHENLDPTDETTRQLHKLLSETKMDVCFLQEHSTLPLLQYALFEHGAKGLCRELDSFVSRFILYETWGRKTGHSFLEKSGLTNQTMTKELTDAYARLAKELSLTVSHVGTHFREVYTRYTEIELYDPDLTHPSYPGSCLAALTHYQTLFGEFPENTQGLSLTSTELDAFRYILSGTK